MKKESKRILKSMFHNSLKNFMCALYDDGEMSQEEIDEIKDYIDKKR